MDVKVTQPDTKPTPEPHHIYLKNGSVISVTAYRFTAHLNKRAVYFYNSDSKNDRNKKIFWSLDEIAGIVADSALAELPPIVNMQKQIDVLATRMDAFDDTFAARMDAFERRFDEALARAVAALTPQA